MWHRYGKDAPRDDDAPGRAQLAIGSGRIGAALSEAQALCIICDAAALPEEAMASALEAAPLLRRVVLLSKMGVSRATGGFMGMGSAELALKQGEERLALALAARGCELSVVRVGTIDELLT